MVRQSTTATTASRDDLILVIFTLLFSFLVSALGAYRFNHSVVGDLDTPHLNERRHAELAKHLARTGSRRR